MIDDTQREGKKVRRYEDTKIRREERKMCPALLSSYLLIFLSSPLFAANDFSGDPNVQGLWTFEDYATDLQVTIADTSGKGNTLTNGQNGSFPDVDEVNNMEGSRGAYSNNTQISSFSRGDAILSADFPGKDGTTNRTISICCWLRPVAFQAAGNMITKYDTTGDQRQYSLQTVDDAGDDYLIFRLGYNNGADQEAYDLPAMLLTATQRYHIGVSYDSVTKNWIMRGWDVTGGTAYTNTGTGTQVMHIDAENLYIFTYGRALFNFQGTLDEIVVWNRAITVEEIDQVRLGTFGASATGAQFIGISMSKDDESVDPWSSAEVAKVFNWEQPILCLEDIR